jgi:hypothetical protein
MVQGALSFLLCLACGGPAAADAPRGVGFSAIELGAAESVHAQSAYGHHSTDARPAAGPRQFDLECDGVHHTFFDRPEDGVPDPPVQPGTVNLRYLVDLESGTFCDFAWCKLAGLARIPAINGDRITFFDTRGPGDLTAEIFDRQTGRYVRRTHTIGLIWLDEGTCREQPFSGFPDGPRHMLASDRNAVRDVATDQSAILVAAYRIWSSGIDRGIDQFYPVDRAEVRELIEGARAGWAERVRRCTDDACEQAILADRVNRYNYSIGQPTMPVSGAPWDSGLVHLTAGATRGRLTVFPIIDDRLLVQVATDNRETGLRCDITAEGHFRPDGSIEMRSLDAGRTSYRFHREDPGRWALEAIDSRGHRACDAIADIALASG